MAALKYYTSLGHERRFLVPGSFLVLCRAVYQPYEYSYKAALVLVLQYGMCECARAMLPASLNRREMELAQPFRHRAGEYRQSHR